MNAFAATLLVATGTLAAACSQSPSVGAPNLIPPVATAPPMLPPVPLPWCVTPEPRNSTPTPTPTPQYIPIEHTTR
jgi:hypothetical protein